MINNKSAAGKLILALPLALMVGACAGSQSPHKYDSHAVGQVRRVERGTVESFRWVEISGESGVGTLAGAGVGAAAGSTIGNGGAESVIGAIGGALVGGLLGHGIEKSASTKGGYEYIIRTESGNLVTLVQADREPLPDGAPVILVFGSDRARVRLDYEAFNKAQQSGNGYQPQSGGHYDGEDNDGGH